MLEIPWTLQSCHSDILIEGRDKTVLEIIVSQQNIALSALDALRKIKNNSSRAILWKT